MAGPSGPPAPKGELPGPKGKDKGRGVTIRFTTIVLAAVVLAFLYVFLSIWTQSVTVRLGPTELSWQVGWMMLAVFSMGFALGKVPFRLGL